MTYTPLKVYIVIEVIRLSIATKQYLVNQVCNDLGRYLTANDLNTVQDCLNNALTMYDVENIDDGRMDVATEEYLNAFISAKSIEGRAKSTIDRYQYIISSMFTEINVPISQVTIFHLRSYLMSKKSRGISDSTLESIRSVMCTFFGWLHKEGLIKVNPCDNLAPIKCQKKVRTPYSSTDIERLKEACKSDRDVAIVLFALATGCRVSEICALNRDSIDFSRHECKVLGKGNKERIVFIDDVTAMHLQRYLQTRNDRSEALFPSKRSDRITPGGIRCMLRQLSKVTGVENVHPHRFRRTLATNLINHGMAIQEVASILGHDKLDTTMKYVYLDKDNVKSAYCRYM